MKEAFESYGLETVEQPFTADGSDYKNIIATYNGDKQKRMIVSAHYDVCGNQPGADDNASGGRVARICKDGGRSKAGSRLPD